MNFVSRMTAGRGIVSRSDRTTRSVSVSTISALPSITRRSARRIGTIVSGSYDAFNARQPSTILEARVVSRGRQDTASIQAPACSDVSLDDALHLTARRKPFSELFTQISHSIRQTWSRRDESAVTNQHLSRNTHESCSRGGDREHGGGHRILRRADGVERERGEVRLFTDLQSAHNVTDTDRLRAADGRQLQHLVRGRRFERQRARALRQQRDTRLLEQIHAIVARHRVRSQSDRDRGAKHLVERSDAVSELGVRDGAMRHARTRLRDARDVLLVDSYAMNEEWLELEHTERMQQFDGRPRARRYGDAAAAQSFGERAPRVDDQLAFDLALRDVYGHTQMLRAREIDGGAKEIVRDRVRRVRRYADAQARRLEIPQSRHLFAEHRHRLRNL